jgi:hypothetical protein
MSCKESLQDRKRHAEYDQFFVNYKKFCQAEMPLRYSA